MIKYIDKITKEKIIQFCHQWKICELAFFGSSLRSDFSPNSDLDILVTFSPVADWSLLDHVQMQYEIQKLLKRNVDLISRKALERSQNWLRREEILNSVQIFYSQKEAMHEQG